MRSPPWVVPRLEPPFGKEKYEKYGPKAFSTIPGLARLFRFFCFLTGEKDWYTMFLQTPGCRNSRKKIEASLIKHMKKTVPEEYHEMLTPDYSVGCKRRIFDAAWLPGLNNPKISLTTRPITEVSSRSLVLGPGQYSPNTNRNDSKGATDKESIPADVIVLGNGFEIQNWLHPLRVRGKNGKLMDEVWKSRGGAQAYMGNAMDGFPNFFIIFGPNTATGHSSVILATENMVEYSLKFIRKILKGDVKTIEVKKESEIAWTKMVQERLKDTVYNSGGCMNWYKAADGWNSTCYP